MHDGNYHTFISALNACVFDVFGSTHTTQTGSTFTLSLHVRLFRIVQQYQTSSQARIWSGESKSICILSFHKKTFVTKLKGIFLQIFFALRPFIT